jgi:uncharacterized protein (TIGR02301 family)
MRHLAGTASKGCVRGSRKMCFKRCPMLRTASVVALGLVVGLTLGLVVGAPSAGAQIFGLQPPNAPRFQPFFGQPQQRPFAPQFGAPQPQFQQPRPPNLAAPAPAPGQQAQPAKPPAQNTPAPYDRDLQRLAEILGSLHFLRGICGANEGQKWRDEAQTLIDTEAPAGERRDLMIASFNRGYRSFQQSYRTCTPAADFAIRRYLAEGAKIAREVTARYAN